MVRTCTWALGPCALLILLAQPIRGADASKSGRSADRYRDAETTAGKINRHLEVAWQAASVVPAAPAEDSEWLRRVYLDLIGRIPSVSEARRFLADTRPDRRALLVEELLASPRHVSHFTTVWRQLLLPEAGNNIQVRLAQTGFERWLRDWVESGKGYDKMVRELLTAEVSQRRSQLAIGGTTANPGAFYAGKDFKPEEIASATSRLFLGINLGCAQCHDHPFAEWKQEQFWSFAAFFASIEVQRRGDFLMVEKEQPDRHDILIPGTEKKVKASYLDGKPAEIKTGMKTREVLATWLTSKDNPYFARAVVNRMWAHFLGTGLFEPMDELAGSDHTASQPAVLDELTRGFVAHDHDLRWLMRVITATRAYQLTSRRSHDSQNDPAQFARHPLRGLTGEQLYDSLAIATGHQESGPRGRVFFLGADDSGRGEFINRFGNSADRPTEVQTSILQALTLMNGGLMSSATNLKSSETLGAIDDAPFMDLPSKIEALYLAALTRKPTARELARLSAHVKKSRSEGEGLADTFWALLNSGEFYLNH